MIGLSSQIVFGLPRALLAIVAILACAPTSASAQSSPQPGADLRTVLAYEQNVSTFSQIVKDYANLFTNLTTSGVTVLVPNDSAFRRFGRWHDMLKSKSVAAVKYHILQNTLSVKSVIKGDSIFAPTKLSDRAFTNVTGGQQLIITKQPSNEVVFTSGYATRGTVVVEDLEFYGGLIQIIDSVMMVPERLETTLRDAYPDSTAFLGALYATNLTSEFANTPNVTIFAPHNAAFWQMARTFLNMEKAELKRILRYHMVPRRVEHSWQLQNASSLNTIDDNAVHITRFNNYVFVNSAQLLQTDILIANGVVHMIDNVLSPAVASARPDVSLTSQRPVFSATASSPTGTAAPTPFTSDLPCTVDCPVPDATPIATSTDESGDGVVRTTSSRGNVAAARCTGLPGAGVGLGLAAMGAVMAAL
ncbi:FAS1 domain-containing protein [Podospora appendiculata]|uniref:FAS1 domain-containing protein n=1 Tax=Podospora appendiculata TaxID=314037 RepID=A0AAE0XBX0_9PEZI|nr:FAS1 domain-containing protein [Podospora appendiculata]